MGITERTRIRNHPERAVPEEMEENRSQGMVSHLGFIQDSVPFGYHYDADTPAPIYRHGSVRSRARKHMASGTPVCVTVTQPDGLGVFPQGDEPLHELPVRDGLRHRPSNHR